jgi:hypothetical protein
MRIHLPWEPSPEQVATALEPIVQQNAQWFLENPGAPCCLGCAGVRYYDVGNKLKCQNFWSAPQVLKRGKATCAEAATYAAGKARSEGKAATVGIEYSDLGGYHAVVWIDGVRTDPSTELEGYQGQPSACACDQPHQGAHFAVSGAPLYIARARAEAEQRARAESFGIRGCGVGRCGSGFGVSGFGASLLQAMGHGMAAFGVGANHQMARVQLSKKTKRKIKKIAAQTYRTIPATKKGPPGPTPHGPHTPPIFKKLQISKKPMPAIRVRQKLIKARPALQREMVADLQFFGLDSVPPHTPICNCPQGQSCSQKCGPFGHLCKWTCSGGDSGWSWKKVGKRI